MALNSSQYGEQVATATNNTTNINLVEINTKKTSTTLSLDFSGRNIALGGKGISLYDLENPTDPPKVFPQQSKWEINLVEWCPHFSRQNYLSYAANQELFIASIDESKLVNLSLLQVHQRAISDLAWSLFDENLLASCSADAFYTWDLRDPKKPLKKDTFRGWTAGATQVKWNRHNAMYLASSHNGEVRIWDIRKVSAPLTFITAHMAKIFGMDWSYSDENELVTCSEDRTVKLWNITTPKVCKGVLQAGTPFAKVRFTPFGRGLITVPLASKRDHSIKLWSIIPPKSTPSSTSSGNDEIVLVHQFEGHQDVPLGVEWRVLSSPPPSQALPSGGVAPAPAKQYQVWSWGKDQMIRGMTLDPALLQYHSSSSQGTAMMSIIGGAKMIPVHDTLLSSSPLQSPTSSSPSAFIPRDFAQELAFLERKKPRGIKIEDVSFHDRYLIVSSPLYPPCKFKMVFPAMYPHGAAPSFQLLPNPTPNPPSLPPLPSLSNLTSLPTSSSTPSLFLNDFNSSMTSGVTSGVGAMPSPHIQARLIEMLSETALEHVDMNRPCIVPCLQNLLLFFKEISEDTLPGSGTPGTGDGFSKLDKKSEGNFNPNIFHCVPAPRSCSAVFDCHGTLHCFFSFHYKRLNNSSFLSPFQATSAPSPNPLSDPLDPPSSTTSTTTNSPTTTITTTTTGNNNGGIRTYSQLKILLSQQRQKEKEQMHYHDSPYYGSTTTSTATTTTTTTTMMPSHSSEFMLFSDPYSLLYGGPSTTSATPSVSSGPGSRTGGPGNMEGYYYGFQPEMIPMMTGQGLYFSSKVMMMDCCHYSPISKELAAHYQLDMAKSREDICQANAAVVLKIDPSRSDLIQYWNLLRLFFHHVDHPMGSHGNWKVHPFGVSLLRSLLKNYMKIRDVQTLAITACLLDRTLPSPARLGKGSGMIGSGGGLGLGLGLVEMEIIPKEMSGLLMPIRWNYAELLWRWQLFPQRIEILKYGKLIKPIMDLIHHPGISMGSGCENCKGETSPCASCESKFRCSICHDVVRGLSVFCHYCGHGGHTTHLTLWFQACQEWRVPSQCPSGCGCACLENYHVLGDSF